MSLNNFKVTLSLNWIYYYYYCCSYRSLVNLFLCVTQIGFCCVYFVFVAANIQEFFKHYDINHSRTTYLLILLVPMIVLNLLKNLKVSFLFREREREKKKYLSVSYYYYFFLLIKVSHAGISYCFHIDRERTRNNFLLHVTQFTKSIIRSLFFIMVAVTIVFRNGHIRFRRNRSGKKKIFCCCC